MRPKILLRQAWAVKLTALCLMLSAAITLISQFIPRQAVFDAIEAGGGAALTISHLSYTTHAILIYACPPLLFLCLPMPTRRRAIGAILLGLVTLTCLAFGVGVGQSIGGQELHMPVMELVLAVPAYALGIVMAWRFFGFKLGVVASLIALGMAFWDMTLAMAFVVAPIIIWLGVMLSLSLAARSRAPGALLPWALALCLPCLALWLWQVVPQVVEALLIESVDRRLAAIRNALRPIGPSVARGGPLSYCALLGCMAALLYPRASLLGDWIAAGALAGAMLVQGLPAKFWVQVSGLFESAAANIVVTEVLFTASVVVLIVCPWWIAFRHPVSED